MNLLSETRRITEPLSLTFTTGGGWHLITISARVKSEKQRGKDETDDEDLTVRINDKTFPHQISKGRLKDSPAAFSGGQLHNKLKTIYFILQLVPGEHRMNLEPQHGAKIVEVTYEKVELEGAKLHIPLEKQAEKANGRPWITFVLDNLPLAETTAKATVEWHFPDGDDVKLIVDGDIKSNPQSFRHKNWIWASSILHKIFGGATQEKSFREDLPSGLHYIEFHADETPTLDYVTFDFGTIPIPPLQAKVVEDGANLRITPSQESASLLSLDSDVIVEVLQKAVKGERPKDENGDYYPTNRWHKVRFKESEGFVISTALQIEGETKSDIEKEIRKTAQELEVDPNLMARLAQEESGLVPHLVSLQDAMGVFQLREVAIKQVRNGEGAYGYDVKDPFDFKENIQGGIRYFKWLHEIYYKDEPDSLEKALIGWNWRLDHTPPKQPIDWSTIPSDVQDFVRSIAGKNGAGFLNIWVMFLMGIILLAGPLINIQSPINMLGAFDKNDSKIGEYFRREDSNQSEVELMSDLNGDGKVEKILFVEKEPTTALKKVDVYLKKAEQERELILRGLSGTLNEVRIVDLNSDGVKEAIITLMPSNRALTYVYTFSKDRFDLVPVIPEDADSAFFNRHGVRVIDLEGDGIKEIYVPEDWFNTAGCQGWGGIYKFYNGKLVKFLDLKESPIWCQEYRG